MKGLVLDGFAGPGGWDEALRALGLPVLGLELDAAACATRAAAGHATVRVDISRFPVKQLAGKVWGSCWSPPCIVFSGAGSRGGISLIDILCAAVKDQFAGLHTLAARRREMVHALRCSTWEGDRPDPHPLKSDPDLMAHIWRRDRQAAWKRKLLARKGSYAKQSRAMAAAAKTPGNHPIRAQRMAKIWAAVRSASLVVESARFIHACHPEWAALEQVPEVLPIWQVYAAELRKAGYSVWTGTLNSADYGVPQTRIRAILIASRAHTVYAPVPTHYDPRKGDQLWGTPWVSMAEALGWGADGRPAPVVTAGGTATGGAEPFGHRDRDMLTSEQEAGRWALRMGNQAHAATRPAPAPAPAIAFGHNAVSMRWVLHTNRGQAEDGSRQVRDPRSAPAPAPAPALTAKSGGQWEVKPDSSWKFRNNNNNNNNNACTRSPDEPAGTLFFGGRSNWAAWVRERPGHKDRVSGGESQFAVDSVRITVQEAAILQSFRPDYPWQGSQTKQFQQIGNACPPLLAEHILAMAAGIRRQEAAA